MKNKFYMLKILFIFIFIFYLIVFKKNITIKVALCVMAKNQNRYIKEFITYYKKLGIKKIILYDNNDINGETFNYLLKKEINYNFIDLINYRGLFKPQYNAFKECYKNNKYKYDWFAFYDSDEFLFIKNYTNLNKFLSLNKFQNCSSILINWKYYGDNEHLYYSPEPIQKRFKKSAQIKKTMHILFYVAAKSIVRGGLNIKWAHFPHYIRNQIICRPDGKKLKTYFSKPQYEIAYIKHYATKSTMEYIEKLLRGGGVTRNNSTRYIKNRIKNYYFLINKITKKKIKLFENSLKIKLDLKVN